MSDLTVEEALVPPLRVFSSFRSGTHFLMASLWRNFEVGDTAATVTVEGQRWFENGAETASIPWALLFGGHCTRATGLELYPGYSGAHFLNVVRHPLDWVHSFWRFVGGDLELSEYATPERFSQWFEQVASFQGFDQVVRYEDLRDDFDSTMRWIESRFGLRRRQGMEDRPYTKPESLVGWSAFAGQTDYEAARIPAVIDAARATIPHDLLQALRYELPKSTRTSGMVAGSRKDDGRMDTFP